MPMQKMLNPDGQKGFVNTDDGKFYPLDLFQKMSTQDGKKGYWNSQTGFVEADEAGASAPAKVIDYANQATQSSGFLQNIGQDTQNRLNNITAPGSPIARVASGDIIHSGPEALLDVAGNVAGSVNNTLSAATTALYKGVVPAVIRDQINSATNGLLDTSIGKKILDAAHSGADAYNKIAEKHPDATRAFENVFNIATLGLTRPMLDNGVQAAKVMANEAKNVAADAANVYTRIAAETPLLKPVVPLAKQLNSKIDSGVSKILNIEKKDYPSVNRAVNHVLDNSSDLKLGNPGETPITGKLPENAYQFKDALDQLYWKKWEESDALQQIAQNRDIRVSPKPLINALEDYKNLVTTGAGPQDVIPYIDAHIARLKKYPSYSINDWQDLTSIAKQYADASYSDKLAVGKPKVDALIYNASKELRNNAIDGAIDSSGNKYASNMQDMADLRTLRDYVEPKVDTTKGTTPKGVVKTLGVTAAAAAHLVKGNLTYGIMNLARLISPGAFLDRKVDNFFSEISSLAKAKQITESAFNPQSALFQDIQSILSRGGKRPEVISTLKAAGVNDAGSAANEAIKQFQLNGSQPQSPFTTPANPPTPSPTSDMPNQPLSLPPGQGFELVSDAEAAKRLDTASIMQNLGFKKIESPDLGGSVTKAERIKRNARRRGLTPENR